MKTLYASVCTLLLISFGCKPEQNMSQSASPMLSTSTPCWAVWTSLDSTIWDYMQHPAEPDDEYANELMYATAMAIQEASCEEGFLDDYFTSITDSGGIFLPDFLNHYPQWTAIFSNNLATYGFNLTDILTNGFTAYGYEYQVALTSPYSNALYPEGIPAIGIGTDIPDDDDSIFDRIPAFIPVENSCTFVEGAVGYSEDYADCEILPYIEQPTFLEFNMIIVSFGQTPDQIRRITAKQAIVPDTTTFASNPSCEHGIGFMFEEFVMFNRCERGKYSEINFYNSSSNTDPDYCISQNYLGYAPNFNEYRHSFKLHRSYQFQVFPMTHILTDPERRQYPDPLNPDDRLVGQDVLIWATEYDWWAFWKKKEFAISNPCSGGPTLYIREFMKYSTDVFFYGSLNPKPMKEDWCMEQYAIYVQPKGAVKITVR